MSNVKDVKLNLNTNQYDKVHMPTNQHYVSSPYIYGLAMYDIGYIVLVEGKDFVSLKSKVNTLGTPYNSDIYVHSILGPWN